MEKTLISYRATRTVLHGRVKYGPGQTAGETVEMTAEEAAPLLALGALLAPDDAKTGEPEGGNEPGATAQAQVTAQAPRVLTPDQVEAVQIAASALGEDDRRRNGKPKVGPLNAALKEGGVDLVLTGDEIDALDFEAE